MTSLSTIDNAPDGKASRDLSVFIAGDAVITQPWSHLDEPEFLKLLEKIRSADVAILNLEMLFHDFKGYPQTISKGTYMAARPQIAKELTWAGFDMVGHANNHTYDYGEIGLLENLENVQKAGLVLAGSGKDLQAARAPAYFRGSKGTVALVATTSSFAPYHRASRSRPDLHGKPGLNPLGVFTEKHWLTRRTTTRVNPKDLEENLAAIREARVKADWVALSIHAHWQGAWLVQFAHQAIDAGVDLFFAHGPHEVMGIEIYRSKPIFYGLGDFFFRSSRSNGCLRNSTIGSAWATRPRRKTPRMPVPNSAPGGLPPGARYGRALRPRWILKTANFLRSD